MDVDQAGMGDGSAEVMGAEVQQGRLPALTRCFAQSSMCATLLDILAERVYACSTKPAGCSELLDKCRQHL